MAHPAAITSHAANTSGYKALVCVFLLGGLDGHDVLLPYDSASYDAFANIRQALIATQGANRQRANLKPLVPRTDTVLASRQIALPPEMPNVKSLFDRGDAAIISNVGPLIEPVTRTTFQSSGAKLPPRLFSHNDQQATWQASAPEGAQFGWGGLFADAVLAAGANASRQEFTTITSGEFGPLLSGRLSSPYTFSTDGPAELFLLADLKQTDLDPERRDLLEAIRQTLGSPTLDGAHILERDMVRAIDGGLRTNDLFNSARSRAASFNASFTGPLGAQLRAVAETISLRSELFASRQIFFVGVGGLDTHSAQATTLPALLAQIDAGIGAFHAAMGELGLENDVTLFTASDFGRSLVVNGNGTDHGWGGHQFAVGGAVNGGNIYGSLPPPAVGHQADTGNGRIIPSVSVEEYAAKLGSWFGLSEGELNASLPNLGNFSRSGLDFI